MLFQALDSKEECKGIYYNKTFNYNNIPSDLSSSWSYCSFLKGKQIEYAKLYCENKTLDEVCPEFLKKEFEEVSNKLKCFKKSFVTAKISLEENCFFNLVPKKFLADYCDIKNKITNHILSTYKRPEEYDFYRRFNEILVDIQNRDLNIDFKSMKSNISKNKDISHYRRLLSTNKNINYNLFGSITGRLSTNKSSFPILNFPKTLRDTIKPHNDWFVAFDMNAAELRTSLALIEKDQPEEDLYEMLLKNVFENKYNRTQVKESVTSWLYNSGNSIALQYEDKLDDLFCKETLLNTYWDGKYVHTPFYRKIQSDKFHAIPYLNQSTFIDLFHRQCIKVDDFLNNKKSFISFFLHDEFVIDMSDEEKENLIDIIKILENTPYGKFIVNVKVGKNYGNMKKIKLKV